MVVTIPSRIKYGISLQTKVAPHDWSVAPTTYSLKTNAAISTLSNDDASLQSMIAEAQDAQQYIPNAIFTQLNNDLVDKATLVSLDENSPHLEIRADKDAHAQRIFVQVQPNTIAKISIEHTQLSVANLVLHISVGEGATVHVDQMHNARAPLHMQCTCVLQERAKASFVDCNVNHEQSFCNVVTLLKGENADAQLYAGLASDHADTFYAMIHDAPNTTSNMVIKGIAGKFSKLVQRGLVKINKLGANCDGYQQTHILKLHDDAGAHALPQLEIDNNDVRCSHGATIQNIAHDQLFYLMSRGMSAQQAKHMLVEGFMNELTQHFTNPQHAQSLLQAALNMLEQSAE